MNKEYYGAALSKDQKVSYAMDILIAIGAAGGSISGLTIWSTQYGKIVWAVFSTTATILALIKPILQINKNIERHTRLFSGHSDIYANMMILASRIKRSGEVTTEIQNSFQISESRFVELSKDDDPKPNFRLLKKCEEMISLRHPPKDAWYPS